MKRVLCEVTIFAHLSESLSFKLYYWSVRSDSKHVFLHLTQQLDNLYPDQPGCTAVYQIINPGNNTPERNINGWGQLFSSFMTPDTCRVKKMIVTCDLEALDVWVTSGKLVCGR